MARPHPFTFWKPSYQTIRLNGTRLRSPARTAAQEENVYIPETYLKFAVTFLDDVG
jgi:hypothetical protein